jgi:hypothetical protein
MIEVDDQTGRPVELSDGWQLATPEEQGMDGALLGAIGPRLAGWPEGRAHGVVIVRHGLLVYERYFAGEDWRWLEALGSVTFGADVRHDIRSITKSVTSLLVGVALDRGLLPDLDRPVLDYFPEHADLRTPEKERITLAHLLTMSGGWAWREAPYASWEESDERRMDEAADPYRYVLERPVEIPPGRVFNYNGGAPTLLQGVVQKVSGRPLEVLAEEALFAPLEIRRPLERIVRGSPRGKRSGRRQSTHRTAAPRRSLPPASWQRRSSQECPVHRRQVCSSRRSAVPVGSTTGT